MPLFILLTPNRAYALFYIRDLEINFVTCSVAAEGYVKYFENFPDQLQTLYEGKCGFLYKCGIKDSFEETSEKDIWVSKKPVSVTAVEEIRDVYAEILKCEANGLVRVFSYETLPKKESAKYRRSCYTAYIKITTRRPHQKKHGFSKKNFRRRGIMHFRIPASAKRLLPNGSKSKQKNSRYTIHSNLRQRKAFCSLISRSPQTHFESAGCVYPVLFLYFSVKRRFIPLPEDFESRPLNLCPLAHNRTLFCP